MSEGTVLIVHSIGRIGRGLSEVLPVIGFRVMGAVGSLHDAITLLEGDAHACCIVSGDVVVGHESGDWRQLRALTSDRVVVIRERGTPASPATADLPAVAPACSIEELAEALSRCSVR